MVSGVFTIPLELHRNSPVSRSRSAAKRWVLREFISGDENALVRAVWDSLLQDSSSYSPILIYGPPGTGKSLLAHGLTGCWKKAFPRTRVVFMMGAEFARHYADAVDTDGVSEFRGRIRKTQLLVLDGLHALAEKPAAQQELIGTLDTAQQGRQKVLVTSPRLPTEIPELLPGLSSRLSGGLTIPLTPPGAAARRVILQRLAASRELELSPTAIRLLAEGQPGRPHPLSTVPQLDQALTHLSETARLTRAAIDDALVREFLRETSSDQRATLRSIASQVARHFQVKSTELRGATRRQQIVRARGVAMYLARSLTDKSLQQVGKFFGNRDHSTVLHACRKTEQLLQSDGALRETVEALTQRIRDT